VAVTCFDAAVPLVLLCADVGFATEPLFGVWRWHSDDSDRTDPARCSFDEAHPDDWVVGREQLADQGNLLTDRYTEYIFSEH
jgi:hypothetical protein